MNIFQTDYYAMEREIVALTNRMTSVGVSFNQPGALQLKDDMTSTAAQLAEQLQVAWPPINTVEWFTPKRANRMKGYRAGIPFPKYKLVPYNPNSNPQTIARLIAQYQWQPTTMTEGGEPSISTAVLATLDFPEAVLLLQYRVTNKRLSMMTGPKGWLASVDDDGMFRCNYSTLGTVTGRSTHQPNVSQVPKVHTGPDKLPIRGAPGAWGAECRGLFSARPGWVLVGSDMQGLELRCLAHFLHPFDAGQYTVTVTEGDPHALTQAATGLASREAAKRLGYAITYGCGDFKAGTIVLPDEGDEFTVRYVGHEVKKALIEGIPGFADLFAALALEDPLIGLDGRRLFVRKAHAKLNTKLQSAGAIACKRWLLLIDAALQADGLRPGEDFEFLIWNHDEVQIEARTMEIAEIVAETCKQQAVLAGQYYHMRCPLAAEAKIGTAWAETH